MIEVMVVVAIIAILALMALPNLTDKIVRDQIIEASKLADVAKGPVAASWALSKKLPADNAEAGLPVAEKIVSNFISSVTVQNGALHLRFGNSAHSAIKGKTLTLRPAVIDDAPVVPVTWVCAQGKVPDKMTLKGSDNTNIDKKYLPLNCH